MGNISAAQLIQHIREYSALKELLAENKITKRQFDNKRNELTDKFYGRRTNIRNKIKRRKSRPLPPL